MCVALEMPTFIVVTKIDLCSRPVLLETLKLVGVLAKYGYLSLTLLLSSNFIFVAVDGHHPLAQEGGGFDEDK